MKKKLLSLLLALCLVMALVPMTAFAEGTSVDNWDGTADTSWYTDHKTDTEYHFTTAEQLAGLAQLVNDKTASVSFEGKTIYLDNDLDLSGFQWTPIGNGDNFVRHFAGTFDGQHHKIMNLYHHYTGDELVRNGLFGVVSDGGTLKNLLVIDADIASNDGSLLAGILADWVNGGTVENCYTSGKIENNVGDKFVGGLIGQCTWSTQVKGCGSDATVISTESDEDHVDTVGGLIGQWENSADSSSITDCWFGGSVSCNNIYSAVGGILGANFENFSGNKPGVIIKNCIVATKNITGAEPGNITWITAVVKTHVTDCIWPDTPPDGVTLDEETYPDNKGNYLAVAKLVVDWDAGTAGADPTFDQSSCGTAVSNFTSADVLAGLQTNAGAGVEWVAGIGHPTFVWDDNNIPADYTAVDAAIARATALDSSLYTNYSAVEDSINSVDRAKSKAQQTEVDAMAKAIEDAIAALQYKDADYTKVDAAIAKANALKKDDYKDFSAVEAAVNAVVRGKNITEQSEVDAMAKAIEDAIAALQYKEKPKICKGGKEVKISNGAHEMRIHGKSYGTFTFAWVNDKAGWSIQNADGKYLSFDNGKLVLRDTAYVWKYDAKFYTTTEEKTSSGWGWWGRPSTKVTNWYLVGDGTDLSISKSDTNADVKLYDAMESTEHSFGKWTPAEDGKHTRTCTICGATETGDCTYENGACTVCGALDPDNASVSVSATVTKRTSGGGGWWGGNRPTTTTWEARITATGTGVDIDKVEYSDDGKHYLTGTSFTSDTEITKFYIRVTDSKGNVTNWLYENGKVTQK